MDKLIVRPGLKNLVPFKNNKPNVKPRDETSSGEPSKVTEGKWGEAKWRIKGDTLEIYGDNPDENHVYKATSIVYDFSNYTSNAPWWGIDTNDVEYLRIYIYISFDENSELSVLSICNNSEDSTQLNHTITKLDLTNVTILFGTFLGLVDFGVVKFTTNSANCLYGTFIDTIIGYLDISSFDLSNVVKTYTIDGQNIAGLKNFFMDERKPFIYTITTPHQFDKYGYFVDEFLKVFTGYYNISTKEQVQSASDIKPNATYMANLDNYDWYLNGNTLIINSATVELFRIGSTSYITCMPWVIHKLEITKVIIKGLIEFPEDLLEFGDELTITLFSDMPNLVEIEGLEHIKLNNITDISNLFNNCPKLQSVKCNGIDVMNYVGLNK